ncbi:hypothetical protein MMEU_2885 [Mycobacterium marinum str. Europe]|nr:hypothetical protein MMEU_2885 [Mycobacterium marinum str. Europe]
MIVDSEIVISGDEDSVARNLGEITIDNKKMPAHRLPILP